MFTKNSINHKGDAGSEGLTSIVTEFYLQGYNVV
jgi:hypothetical protein